MKPQAGRRPGRSEARAGRAVPGPVCAGLRAQDPNLEFSSWFGIVAPARTPPEVVARLNADVVRAVQSLEGRAKMEEAGFRVTGTSAQEFARTIAADTVTWGKAVAATGFKAD